MPTYCQTCESTITRDEEVTRLDGQDYCLDCYQLAKPITDRAGITAFLEYLERSGWLYHLDDDPHDIEHWSHGCGRDCVQPTEQQVDLIADQVQACLTFDTAFTWDEVSRLLACD
jgi:hypothetical protein